MQTYYPTVKIFLDEGAYPLTRAYNTDAGADIRTPYKAKVPARGSIVIDTGVHVELPENTKGELVSKSGLNINHCLLTFGLIDEGYDGMIRVRVYNLSDEDYLFEQGEKITQLVISHVCYPTYIEADEIRSGERGSNGFGSTGRA